MNLSKNRFLLLVVSCVLFIAIWKIWSAFLRSEAMNTPKGSTVSVAEISDVIKQTVPYTVSAPGTLNTSQIINVNNRVEGEIIGIHFQEGQIVKENDLLYTIDVRNLETQLKQAEGVLERDKALLENARASLVRNESMLKQRIISQAIFDQIKSAEQSAEATVKSNQANVDLIKLQISYGKIKSPITGRIGFTSVNVGNLIKPSNVVPLTTILKLDPIQFTFSLSEKYLPFFANKDFSSLKISLLTEKNEEKPSKGKLVAIDNTVNPNTGSFQLKAHFENKNFDLFSGQFFNIRITLEEKKDVLVVPITAIQTGPNGNYVFTCAEETKIISMTPIKLGLTSETFAVIEEGVKLGDLVVISGQNRCRDGTKATTLIKQSTADILQGKKK